MIIREISESTTSNDIHSDDRPFDEADLDSFWVPREGKVPDQRGIVDRAWTDCGCANTAKEIGTNPNYFYTSIVFRPSEKHTAMINTNRERLNYVSCVQPLIYVIRKGLL